MLTRRETRLMRSKSNIVKWKTPGSSDLGTRSCESLQLAHSHTPFRSFYNGRLLEEQNARISLCRG